jgi:hypothetical protein
MSLQQIPHRYLYFLSASSFFFLQFGSHFIDIHVLDMFLIKKLCHTHTYDFNQILELSFFCRMHLHLDKIY